MGRVGNTDRWWCGSGTSSITTYVGINWQNSRIFCKSGIVAVVAEKEIAALVCFLLHKEGQNNK